MALSHDLEHFQASFLRNDAFEEDIHLSVPGFSNAGIPLSENKYRSFIENLPVLFYAVDPTPP